MLPLPTYLQIPAAPDFREPQDVSDWEDYAHRVRETADLLLIENNTLRGQLSGLLAGEPDTRLCRKLLDHIGRGNDLVMDLLDALEEPPVGKTLLARQLAASIKRVRADGGVA